MTVPKLSPTMMMALMLTTMFLTASKVRGQLDQTIDSPDIFRKAVAAWVPNTTNLERDAPSTASQQDGQVRTTLSGAKNIPGTSNTPQTGKQTKRILYIVPISGRSALIRSFHRRASRRSSRQ